MAEEVKKGQSTLGLAQMAMLRSRTALAEMAMQQESTIGSTCAPNQTPDPVRLGVDRPTRPNAATSPSRSF